MNNSQVAHAWAHGKKGTGSNFASPDGKILISYSTLIAARIDDIIYISADNMSPSTTRHISYARQAVSHERGNIFYTPAFSWSGSNPRLTHEAMILPAVRDALQTVERALAAPRTRSITKMQAVQAYMERRDELVTLAARVGVALPDMPEYPVDVAGIAAYRERAKETARINAEKQARLQRIEDEKQFDAWLAGGAVRFPASYSRFAGGANTDFIRMQDDKIVTSQGAECPLDHAKKAIAFYQSRTVDGVIFTPWQTNGHKIPLGMFTLDSIDSAGNVKAGCHTFTAVEIVRFCKQWNI